MTTVEELQETLSDYEKERKVKVQKRLDYLTEMLAFQIAASKAAVPYNTKKLELCNKKERDIRLNRQKRILKLERRVRNCLKVLNE
jgi:hypothetical protein